MWRIIGGEKEGLLVRAGPSLTEALLPQRLAQNALVDELGRAGSSRLHYRLISGTGPSEGWISTQIAGKTLAVKLEEAPGAAADGSWSTEGTGSMPPELATILEKGTKHVTACACDQEDLQMFHAIRQELSQGQRPFSGNWRPANDGKWKTPWRNGLGSEQVEAADGQKLPYLAKTLRKLMDMVNAEMLQWWANFYEDGSVGCEFHHDGHAEHNITVGASFGAARLLTFHHEDTGAERSFLQRNGDIFAFDHSVDEALGPRISVIIMGRLRPNSGLHRSFVQDQRENRQNFFHDCIERFRRLEKSIETQEATLLEKEASLRKLLEETAMQALEEDVGELLERKHSSKQSMQLLLEEFNRNTSSSAFAQLQMKGISLMKQQQALLKDFKALVSKEEKMLCRPMAARLSGEEVS
ncbi:unnamed protein product [Durusdinium trenchii]|uniref:Uncharacterized protein n=1 Tax=Durusdinium trenchii TaxID=1381693 RepID=A0ABP0NCE5_9DINO